MNRLAAVVVLLGCASKDSDPPPPPADDHELHRTETAGGIKITGNGVPLATQPMLEWIGLPMSGDVDVAIDIQHLDSPKQAEGTIRISCPEGCRLGDDKTGLKPPRAARASAFAGDLQFGHIDFDRVTIAIDIREGKGVIRTFDVVSKDVVLELDGTIEVGRPFASSRVDLCVRFNSTPELEARDPKTHAVLQVTGAPRARNGLFNIKLTDTLAGMRRLGVICDGSEPAPVEDAAPPAVASSDVDADLAKLIASAVKSTSATTFEIDAAIWSKLFTNPSDLAKGARIVPAIKNGKPQGFKLYAIKPGSLVAQLGLQNGDTLVGIDGLPITSAEKGLEAYTKLRDTKVGEPIDVVVVRKGVATTLTYKLQ